MKRFATNPRRNVTSVAIGADGPDYLEVWAAGRSELRPLPGPRVTIGRGETNDMALSDDARVSRLHAVLERLGDRWTVRDLGSRNGTFVNGERVERDFVLNPGDEVSIGQTRLVYRSPGSEPFPMTEGFERAPDLTPREREVLLALFVPALDADVFNEPATTRQMAEMLHVSEAAVKQHLLRLYDKFAIHGDGERRRIRLANEAMRRSAVTLTDVRAWRATH